MTNHIDPATATRFVSWMLEGVIAEARGDRITTLPVRPDGRFWLGRLAPEIVVQNSRLGERTERLDPCEVGVRVRLSAIDGRNVTLFRTARRVGRIRRRRRARRRPMEKERARRSLRRHRDARLASES